MWIVLETKRRANRGFWGHLFVVAVLLCGVSYGEVQWRRQTIDGPNSGNQQTACAVADFDKDGIVDFAVTERTRTPSIVWYKYNGSGWDKRIIDNAALKPEAGGDCCDIDGDGDLDILMKPYNHNAPRIDILLNMGPAGAAKP